MALCSDRSVAGETVSGTQIKDRVSPWPRPAPSLAHLRRHSFFGISIFSHTYSITSRVCEVFSSAVWYLWPLLTSEPVLCGFLSLDKQLPPSVSSGFTVSCIKVFRCPCQSSTAFQQCAPPTEPQLGLSFLRTCPVRLPAPRSVLVIFRAACGFPPFCGIAREAVSNSDCRMKPVPPYLHGTSAALPSSHAHQLGKGWPGLSSKQDARQ